MPAVRPARRTSALTHLPVTKPTKRAAHDCVTPQQFIRTKRQNAEKVAGLRNLDPHSYYIQFKLSNPTFVSLVEHFGGLEEEFQFIDRQTFRC